MPQGTNCLSCKHYLGQRECEAFDKIPDAIWLEGDPHTKPLKGQDNKIVYQKIKANG